MSTKLTYKHSDTPYLVVYVRAKPSEPQDESQIATAVEKFTGIILSGLQDMGWEPIGGNVDLFIP